MDNHRRGRYILTVSGQRFWPLDARPREVDPNDIAHALSNICRFSGHVSDFYSVAQHCCHVADAVFFDVIAAGAPLREAKMLAFEGLLHDATEAYLNDVSTPVKASPELAGYRGAEARLAVVIADRFDLPRVESAIVKWADRAALVTEARDLMPPSEDWGKMSEPIAGLKIVPLAPVDARREWLRRFEELRTR